MRERCLAAGWDVLCSTLHPSTAIAAWRNERTRQKAQLLSDVERKLGPVEI